ncbi:MAG: transcription termination factor Rho [Desulfomonilaceae bacterium]
MAGKKKEQKEKKEKPLERWTIKELREEALKVPETQGIHGMNKEELLAILRKAKGIEEPPQKKAKAVRDVKAKISELKKVRDEERAQGVARTRLDILRRKISRLKKLTRRAA